MSTWISQFVANYDRRHVVNIQAAYDMNERWTFGATFTYQHRAGPLHCRLENLNISNYHPDVITERNGYRLPAFHRLDLSATLYAPKKFYAQMERINGSSRCTTPITERIRSPFIRASPKMMTVRS